MDALDEREDLLLEALHKDLGKSRGEGYMTEVGMVRSEIKEALINVEAWSHPKKADGSFLTFFPATNHIYTEPYGVVLIIAPWNYPLNLTLMPLVGAIAAGNCAIVKCSPESVHTSRAIKDLLADLFPPEYIYCPEADLPSMTLWQEGTTCFFTGSPAAGRIVMKAASEHLTPVIFGIGWQESLPCRCLGEHRSCGTAHRLGKIHECRSNLHCRGLRCRTGKCKGRASCCHDKRDWKALSPC